MALVGTVQAKQRRFPERLKDLKQTKKYGARGDMRYMRVGQLCLFSGVTTQVH